jgi:endonuclease/exonuclease/phosphatase family metal-dependent hydrolase
MKIGTWNLAGRWGDDHRKLLESLKCDVWLLTEVREDVALEGYEVHLGAGQMHPRRRFAGVLSLKAIEPLKDPHGASAAARINGIVYCSSILPWRACGKKAPWSGETHTARTVAAVDTFMAALPDDPLVWGGDWNHALEGKEYAGSVAGRTSICDALGRRGLKAHTKSLPHRIAGLLSIDHIAVPKAWTATPTRVSAVVGGKALSDHDLYVLEVPAR